MRKTVVGVFTFWYQLTNLKNSLLVLVCASGRGCSRPSAGAGLAASGRVVWPFVLPAFYLNAVLAVLLALGRYSAPVLPALLVVSAFGVDTLIGPVALALDVSGARGPAAAATTRHLTERGLPATRRLTKYSITPYMG